MISRSARQLLREARAVLIVPRLYKGGFIVGGEGGEGVLMRDQFEIGAQAGIAVANLGSGVKGAVGAAVVLTSWCGARRAVCRAAWG